MTRPKLLDVFSGAGGAGHGYPRPGGTSRGIKARNLDDARDALGIPWMDWHDLAESIPPAFSTWIGSQLIEALREAA